MRRLFITGTDTDAGKTFASSVVLKALAHAGYSTFGLKPIAAGCEQNAEGTWVNDDAIQLQAASQPALPYSTHNPIALIPPIAPHIAAEQAGISLSVETLTTAVNPEAIEYETSIPLLDNSSPASKASSDLNV